LLLCDGTPQAINKNISDLLNGIGWEKAVTIGPELNRQTKAYPSKLVGFTLESS